MKSLPSQYCRHMAKNLATSKKRRPSTTTPSSSSRSFSTRPSKTLRLLMTQHDEVLAAAEAERSGALRSSLLEYTASLHRKLESQAQSSSPAAARARSPTPHPPHRCCGSVRCSGCHDPRCKSFRVELCYMCGAACCSECSDACTECERRACDDCSVVVELTCNVPDGHGGVKGGLQLRIQGIGDFPYCKPCVEGRGGDSSAKGNGKRHGKRKGKLQRG